ncbi:MAG: hypothetical protein AB1726_16660 [Planctomycetota bacterium]
MGSERTTAGWRWGGLAVLASAWGCNELAGPGGPWRAAVALFALAAARALVDRPGASTAVALAAVLFRAANAAPFFCHLLGIALYGVAFDVAAMLFRPAERRLVLRGALAGLATGYVSCFLFAASVTWIVPYGRWAERGLAGVRDHVLFSGTEAALAGLVAVPLGFWIGERLATRAARRPRWALGGAAALGVACWGFGLLAG